MEKEALDPRKYFSVDEKDVRSYRLSDGTFLHLGLGIPKNCVELYTGGFSYLKLKKGAERDEEKIIAVIDFNSCNDVYRV